MPMKATHRAGSAPVALALCAWTPAPWPVALAAGLTAWGVSIVNDWDHPNYQRRMHLGAVAVRWSARLGYALRTSKDKRRTDLHRGPSHSLEWCALFGLAVGLLATMVFSYWGVPEWGPWFGVAVFAGTASHVLLDWLTPSGVPLCALYNLAVHREVWRRHAVGWWVPFYEVSWWLRWIRLPRPMAVDDRHPGCAPGLFHTDRGGEHLVVVPLLYATTGVLALWLVGALSPVAAFLVPVLA